MSSKKLVDLVNAWAAYEAKHPEMEISDFCTRYLSDHAETIQPRIMGGQVAIPVNNWLSALLGRLSRYAFIYTKKALAPLGLSSVDDIIYLFAVLEQGEPRKSDVIYKTLSEYPSGIDVIKRLVKLSLLEELPDETDKRSKRLRMTPKGHDVLGMAFPMLSEAADAAFGTLSHSEKMTLGNLMARLDEFHWEHYHQTRTAETIEKIGGILKKEE
jgi:DNA-binding MarR family transcriptional regulator